MRDPSHVRIWTGAGRAAKASIKTGTDEGVTMENRACRALGIWTGLCGAAGSFRGRLPGVLLDAEIEPGVTEGSEPTFVDRSLERPRLLPAVRSQVHRARAGGRT